MAFPVGPVNPLYKSKAHRDARATLIAAYTPGDPCCRCGAPMWPPTSELHADHVEGSTTQYRGLAHALCNRIAGARRGRAIQVAGVQANTTRIQW